ncbi:Cysteine synthase 2 [Glycine soja]
MRVQGLRFGSRPMESWMHLFQQQALVVLWLVFLSFFRVTRAVMYTKEEADGRRLKNPFDTITEGIGINRITRNFAMAKLDGAFRGTDREAVEMSRFLLKNDGLFLGSSSAMNCVGAVRVAQAIGPGHTIVTILCDSGMRHLSKFYDAEYLSLLGLTPKATGLELLGIK